MDVLLLPLKWMGEVFIFMPLWAFVPAVFFFFLYLKRKQKLMFVASMLWVLYLVYEYGIKLHILCDGDCNIRIDLLFIYPLLLIISFIALYKMRK